MVLASRYISEKDIIDTVFKLCSVLTRRVKLLLLVLFNNDVNASTLRCHRSWTNKPMGLRKR